MADFSNLVVGLIITGAVGYGAYSMYSSFGGGASAPSFDFPKAAAKGELVVDKSEVGSWTMQVTTCQSGEHTGFYGVDLAEPSGRIGVRLARDPVRGFAVLLRAPDSDKAGTLTAETCKGLAVEVRRTNTTVNTIRLLDGEATFDCDLPGGGHARLHATFTGCQ